MTILVAVASRHHSTFEIGQAIGRTLVGLGVPADVLTVEEVEGVGGYDAVVLGSGVYAGNWLPAARDFVSRCASGLTDRPVWLFSSGPMGDPPKPAGDPSGIAAIVERIQPRGHRVFPGRLDGSDLGFGEKLVIKAVRAPLGDFRDWPAVESWAAEIAAALDSPAGVAPEPVGAARG